MPATSRPTHDLSGQSLGAGRYHLVRFLHRGDRSNIYLAQDARLEAAVAVKLVHSEILQSKSFVDTFTRAARQAVMLTHGGLVRAFDFGYTASPTGDKQFYLVMEHLDGPNLARLFAALRAEQHWLPLDEALYLIRRIGAALVYAHHTQQRRLVLPRHIMLREAAYEVPPGADQALAYQPVLIDPLDTGDMGEVTTTLSDPQSQIYLSPQAILGEKTDQRADIYSLGILAWELIFGRPFLRFDSLATLVDHHLNRRAPDPIDYPALPRPLLVWLLKAIAYSPDARFDSVRAMLEPLDAFPPASLRGLLPPDITAPGTTTEPALMRLYRRYIASPDAFRDLSDRAPAPQPVAVSDAETSPPTNSRSAGASQPVADSGAPLVASKLLLVQSPGHGERRVEFDKPRLSLGRSPDNDIVVDDARVSRKHAIIEFDGASHHVTDLDSANGTFLDQVRVSPQRRLPWPPGSALSVGNFVIRLIDRASTPQPAPFAPALPQQVQIHALGIRVDRSRIRLSSDGGLGLFVNEPEYSVEPGQQTEIPIVVLNASGLPGGAPRIIDLSADGLPPAWTVLHNAQANLAGGEQHMATVEVRPPRSPQSRAATYTMHVRAVSPAQSFGTQEQVATVDARVKITPFAQVVLRLESPSVSVGEPIGVLVENQGNTAQALKLMWWGDEPGLTFNPAEGELTLQPGHNGRVAFTAHAQQSGWFTAGKIHAVTIQVHPQHGAVQLLKAEIVRRGRLGPPSVAPR